MEKNLENQVRALINDYKYKLIDLEKKAEEAAYNGLHIMDDRYVINDIITNLEAVVALTYEPKHTTPAPENQSKPVVTDIKEEYNF